MGKLNELKVKNAKAGRHIDGDGLHLQVKPSGSRSWVVRVQHNGRREEIGLGGYPVVTLSEAREKALEMRRLVKRGENARAIRDKGKVRIPTFAEAMEAAHAELSQAWAPKTGEQFLSSLKQHATPRLGSRPVDQIEVEDVRAILAPIWTAKPQIARKVRHRVLQVLSFSKSHGWRSTPAPDAKELSQGLASQPKSKGFASVPHAQVPVLVAGELGKSDSPARLAMLFAIFTAARSGEVRRAEWCHIDLDGRTWFRPAEIMKAGREHTVTLNDAALAILEKAKEFDNGKGLVFPSVRGKVLSDAALGKMLRTAGRVETVHGFRKSFRNWAAEKMPHVPFAVAEMAIAHSVGTNVEKVYLTSDLIELRRGLMDAWGRYAAPSLSAEQSNRIPVPASKQAGE